MLPLPVAARVRVKFWLDGQPIVLLGRGVTLHPQFGNGIMFMDYEGEAEVLLKRYLDAIVTECGVPQIRAKIIVVIQSEAKDLCILLALLTRFE
jgi:hypothetical protein